MAANCAANDTGNELKNYTTPRDSYVSSVRRFTVARDANKPQLPPREGLLLDVGPTTRHFDPTRLLEGAGGYCRKYPRCTWLLHATS
jgi:hypothetical protein